MLAQRRQRAEAQKFLVDKTCAGYGRFNARFFGATATEHTYAGRKVRRVRQWSGGVAVCCGPEIAVRVSALTKKRAVCCESRSNRSGLRCVEQVRTVKEAG